MTDSAPLKGKAKEPAGLRYIGNGAALAGVPARDLSADEIAELANYSIDFGEPNWHATPIAVRRKLIASGLYEEA